MVSLIYLNSVCLLIDFWFLIIRLLICRFFSEIRTLYRASFLSFTDFLFVSFFFGDRFLARFLPHSPNLSTTFLFIPRESPRGIPVGDTGLTS